MVDEPNKPTPGMSLLFASRAEIDAAPAAEREAYLAWAERLVANPETFGLKRESSQDSADADRADRRTHALNQEWSNS